MTITWSITINSKSSLIQVVILAFSQISFMIVTYALLDVPSSNKSCFYVEPSSFQHNFSASTTESNCGVPGMFVFPLEQSMSSFSINK
jgi:hypothetical protein